jgi:hypothetical protein
MTDTVDLVRMDLEDRLRVLEPLMVEVERIRLALSQWPETKSVEAWIDESPLRMRVEEAVSDPKGMSLARVAEAAGLSSVAAEEALADLANQGRVRCVRWSRKTLWFPSVES